MISRSVSNCWKLRPWMVTAYGCAIWSKIRQRLRISKTAPAFCPVLLKRASSSLAFAVSERSLLFALWLNLPVCRGRSQGKDNAPSHHSVQAGRTPRARCTAANPALSAVPRSCRIHPPRLDFWCAVTRTNAVKSLSDEVVFHLSGSKCTVSARFQNEQRVQVCAASARKTKKP